MGFLQNILKKLLKESASEKEVSDAIENHEQIIINYKSPRKQNDTANGERVIEVYAYGDTKAGNPVIRAFQPYGDTTTRVPSWKFFRLDGILSWQPTGKYFSHPASEDYKGLGEFNPNGDKTMLIVKQIAHFDKEEPTQKPEEEIFKTDTEKRMDYLRTQLENPRKIDLSQFDKNKQPPQTLAQLSQKMEQEPDVYKTDTEKRMDYLRKQLENPRKIDLNQFNKKEQSPQTLAQLSQKMKQEPDVYKTDTEKRMEYLKQQLENPRKINLNTSISDKETDKRIGNQIDKLEKELKEPQTLAQLSQKMKQKPDVYKTDTERNMENLRQQLQNPRKIDLSQIPKN